MAGTRRIPINRPPRNLLSQRAINLFRLASTYHDPDTYDPVFANLAIELHRELGLERIVLQILVDLQFNQSMAKRSLRPC